MGKYQDLSGKKFNFLTVLKREKNIYGKPAFLCLCDCGKTSIVSSSDLKHSRVKSCGCMRGIGGKIHRTTHGLSKTRIYKTYLSMKQRCYNKNCTAYKNYGLRGIKICDEWLNDFKNFYQWSIENGYKNNLTIERIDFNGNYQPSNCKWATTKEQGNNTRHCVFVTIDGVTKTIKQWCEHNLIDIRVFSNRRYTLKWDLIKALTQPTVRKKRRNSCEC